MVPFCVHQPPLVQVIIGGLGPGWATQCYRVDGVSLDAYTRYASSPFFTATNLCSFLISAALLRSSAEKSVVKFTAPTTREIRKIFISDRDSIFSKPVLSGQTADLHM